MPYNSSLSYSFHLRTTIRPSLSELVERLVFTDIVTWPGPPSEGTLYFYRTGLSTRPTEITFRDRSIEVRILALACAEDLELALRIVEQLADLTGAQIRSEEDEVIPAQALRDRFNIAWIEHMVASSASTLIGTLRTPGKTVALAGPVRVVHIGPRLFAELEAAGPINGLTQRLLDQIRHVQYRDLTPFHQATVLEVRQGRQLIALSHWSADQATHFPGTPYIQMLPNNRTDGAILIPYETLPELAGARFSWLDEKQCLVEPIPSDQWQEILDRAERFQDAISQPRRRWWRLSA